LIISTEILHKLGVLNQVNNSISYTPSSVSDIRDNSIFFISACDELNQILKNISNCNNCIVIVPNNCVERNFENKNIKVHKSEYPKKLFSEIINYALLNEENAHYLERQKKSVYKPNSKVSESSIIFEPCEIGEYFLIEEFSVIGQDGWSSITDANDIFKQFPHIGGVKIGSNVSIGSYVTIDRGTLTDTIIGNNVRINDRVHLAHNVVIGNNTKIGANSCISGGTKIGNNCYIGPGVIFVGHNVICDNCIIGAGTIVTKNITEPGTYINRLKIKKLR
jgi:UDP-3-O-[3-hydroxymyristoyl] glucosamine N-acyltransferase